VKVRRDRLPNVPLAAPADGSPQVLRRVGARAAPDPQLLRQALPLDPGRVFKCSGRGFTADFLFVFVGDQRGPGCPSSSAESVHTGWI
jgi:hypothetical protein